MRGFLTNSGGICQTGTMTTENKEKDQTYWKVLSAAIELDFKKGHQKWTLSELSRKSKVTRSLIYYYFGRSKMSILDEAIKIIGDELVGLNDSRMTLWKQGRFVESLLEARFFHQKAPFISSFVMAHVRADNSIGERLREIEQSFISKIRSFFPQLSNPEVDAVYAIYWGAVFCPIGDENSMMLVMKSLNQTFFKLTSNQ